MNKFEPLQTSLSEDPYKQHINLSFSAWNVIESDSSLFSPNQSPVKLSGFFNRLYTNYLLCLNDESNCTLPLPDFGQEFHSELSHLKRALPKLNLDSDCIHRLREDFVKRCQAAYQITNKGVGKKYRLQKEVAESIALKSGKIEECIFQKPGKYLSSFYEHYTKMPYINREYLYFYNQIRELYMNIDRNRSCYITTSGNCFHIIPYKICADSAGNFNYLVALSKLKNSSDQYKLTSFRISRIQEISLFSTTSPIDISSVALSIEQDLQQKGVQFLLAETTPIKIRLSDYGKTMFLQQSHLRPILHHIENSNIYCFDCTEMQAEFYFFKFGANAEVLSPQSLREKFYQQYLNALSTYQK